MTAQYNTRIQPDIAITEIHREKNSLRLLRSHFLLYRYEELGWKRSNQTYQKLEI